MGEEPVREPGQTRAGVLVIGGQGLIGEVARREHQRRVQRSEQQVVERRVRQEHAKPPIASGHRWRDGATRNRTRLKQHDGAGRAGQQAPLECAQMAQGLRYSQIPRHHRKRLGPAPLPIPEPAHGGLIGGVAREVVPAKPLDRHDLARTQRRHGSAQRGLCHRRGARSSHSSPGQRWAADCTGNGFRVEPAVARVAVLSLTGTAEREWPHGGLGAVVRKFLDDGRPGSAVGAVGERVAIAAVRRVKQLAQTVVTGGDVRREQPVRRRRDHALVNLKRQGQRQRIGCRLKGQHGDALNAGARRGVGAQPPGKLVKDGRWCGCLNLHPARGVAHTASQTQLRGQTPDEGAEADALNHALDMESAQDTWLLGGRDAVALTDGCCHSR